MTAASPSAGRRFEVTLGRPFVSPLFDLALIGGGLSLPVLWLVLVPPDLPGLRALSTGLRSLAGPAALPYAVMLTVGAHFAASTVRLYTKQGTTTALPFLTLAFPLVALLVVSVAVFQPDVVGRQLQSLYLTWSPYHYAAQAYGLAVMYCYRSGCALGDGDKQLLRAASLLPFLYSFLSTTGAGLHWILPDSLYEIPAFVSVLATLRPILRVAGLAAPFLLWLKLQRGGSGPMPIVSVLLLLVNGVWWYALDPIEAFVWATFFHGIQYLAIVIIFHVKEQLARPGARHGALYHTLWFYGVCLLLAYALFDCLPQVYMWAGASVTQSLLIVAAAINLHHFIVDGFIWRLGRRDANRAVVDSGVPTAPATAA